MLISRAVFPWSTHCIIDGHFGADFVICLSGGRRYGTLCVCDVKARTFTAEMYHLLINFAELAVQELERDSVRRMA